MVQTAGARETVARNGVGCFLWFGGHVLSELGGGGVQFRGFEEVSVYGLTMMDDDLGFVAEWWSAVWLVLLSCPCSEVVISS